MPANNYFKNRVIICYCIVFYILMVYKLLNGMLLFQLQPSFFYSRLDIFTWLFMQTGLHQALLNNRTGWVTADILFYSMPAVYLLMHYYSEKRAVVVAVAMLVINWCYVQCYTLFPSNSIVSHIPWLVFPVLFMARAPRTFSFIFEGLRYFFLFLFSSAAVWKIVLGGIFNIRQMSAILLYQHSQFLTSSPEYWQSRLYSWLIRHDEVSYLLYLMAFLAELSFVAGFFTKRFDKWLVAIFILFLVMDHLVMRIPYYEWSPFLLTFLIREKKT